MNKLFKYKSFAFGFLFGLVSFFLAANYFDKKDRNICFDCNEKFGFPFYSLETGGQVFEKHYLWFGLIGNVLIALVFSLIIGLIFKFASSEIASRRSSLK